MVARGLRLSVVVLLCGLVCVVAVVVPGVAGATQFGARRFALTEGRGGNEPSTLVNSGQIKLPVGEAVDNDPSSLFFGDVYVADLGNGRVDRFSGLGVFQLAWGQGVVNGANELQACTTSCRGGIRGSVGTGAVSRPTGVAVDNDPLSLSAGDVYVVDSANDRVEKFGPSGEFLLMFGGAVNEETGGNVCVAGEACRAGTSGSGDGYFEGVGGLSSAIAVGPTGVVYVGDRARVQVFEPSGVWKESFSLSGLSSSGDVTALAVDSAGDVFVKDSEASGVREFEPDKVESSVEFDASSTSVTSLATDGSGDLFVGDASGGFHVSEYVISSGAQVAGFGSGTVQISSESSSGSRGMAFSEASGELYVSEYNEARIGETTEYNFTSSVWILSVPPVGPWIESASVTVAPRGQATLEGTVNPEGSETTYHFEYVADPEFRRIGYAGAAGTASISVGSSFEDQPVSGQISGLPPSTVYHYRLVATSAVGSATGPDQTFETSPPALVDALYATDVASSSATINAEVDPLGSSTQYRLEYGTSSAYGQILSGSVGEGTTDVLVSYHRQGLMAGTVYHYRIVITNDVGTVEGADHTFTTQSTSGQELALSDGRMWELVSPANKKGAVIEPFQNKSNIVQAAGDGSGIAYVAEGPHVGENPASKSLTSYVLSRRGPNGWGSADIDMPRRNVSEGESALSISESGTGEFPLYSPDLSLALAEPTVTTTPPLSAEATERTLYLRDNGNGSYLPLVTGANVLPGAKFGGEEDTVSGSKLWMRFITATPDLSHTVFESPFALTPDATSVILQLPGGCGHQDGNGISPCGLPNLYEWTKGQLQLVNILPNGHSTTHEAPGPGGSASSLGESVYMAGEGAYEYGLAARAISADGRWVAWTWGNPYENGGNNAYYRGLYVRDMVTGKTFELGGSEALYQTMSSDGSRIFFLEKGALYEFDTSTGTQGELVARPAGEANAGVQESVSAVSEDGSYVYIVDTGVLTNGGVSGQDNLYLLHESGGAWTTTYVATLSREDEKDWYERAFAGSQNLAGVSSRVSPSGRYFAFMSNRSLTGYDNRDVNSGRPDEEVYLYDAAHGRLVCASCNPTGARPAGVLDSVGSGLLVDKNEFWGNPEATRNREGAWLAGSVPGWDSRAGGDSLYQPRYLLDSGRLFFDSADALVPQDTNGLEDVYEYEPSGVGGEKGCSASSTTFSERSGGCVNLLSSGTSSSESLFYDASENGDDVFFLTSSRLTAADYDNAYDVYDAHVCSTSAPCTAAPVSPPPCTSGDSCKAAPAPQPDIFGPTPSATFNGVGNVVGSVNVPVVTRKSLTRSQKLERALRVCHKKKVKKRAVCERQAHKRYSLTRSRNAKTTGKGGR